MEVNIFPQWNQNEKQVRGLFQSIESEPGAGRIGAEGAHRGFMAVFM